MTSLTITPRPTANGPVLALAGDLDYATAPQLRDTVGSTPLQAGQQLILDLAGLRFCDSSGISAIIAARNTALTAQANLVLAAVPAHTLHVLHTIGLDQILHIRSHSPRQSI